MNFRKAIAGLMMMTAVTLATAGAAKAAQTSLTYSTVFSPDPILIGGTTLPTAKFQVDVVNGAVLNNGTPSNVNLATFYLFDIGKLGPNNTTFSQDFTIDLTVAPVNSLGVPTAPLQTKVITGKISGTVGATTALSSLKVDVASDPTLFTFSDGSIFKFSSFLYTPFGAPGASLGTGGLGGTLAATVTAVPEPGEVAFAVIFGTGLLGMIGRARIRNKRSIIAA